MSEELNFSLKQEVCEKCGATWLNGEHRWTGTGAKGNELDLAGLVCNSIRKDDPDYSKCINPKRGVDGGTTWEYRRGYVDGSFETEMKHAKRKSDQG